MRRFAYVANAVAARNGKLDKVALIADYLASLDDADVEAAARFFTGNPFAARDQRSLNLGYRAIISAAQTMWGFDSSELSQSYRQTGDLGTALGPLMREPATLSFFASEALTPATLAARFSDIANASGKSATKTRTAILEEILRACTDPLEATYVVKIITGDLRIGLREGLIHDAIAAAFQSTFSDVHRAAMAAGDVGAVAVAAKHGHLDQIKVAYGSPIGFMLASPLPFGGEYRELGDAMWMAEDKFDGIRAQAHVRGDEVTIYSRNMNDVTASYPEVAQALRGQSHHLILDGEIIAARDGKALPFRTLQARLQRKDVGAALMNEVPLHFMAFDLLALDGTFLIDEPLSTRREKLASSFIASDRATLATHARIHASDVNAQFEAARARGNEGLMLKRADSPYAPGRRGKWWYKLKRELSTLDVVVIAVEWGHGKRAKVLSDYTFAVRDEAGALRAIGKAYSGLTDAEIAQYTTWFLQHQIGKRGRALEVEPTVVLEVAFDVIQKSTLHDSGYSLRFPRIVRIRDDKPAAEIDTIADVNRIYEEMLQREQGLAEDT